jgi:hypothetical protein
VTAAGALMESRVRPRCVGRGTGPDRPHRAGGGRSEPSGAGLARASWDTDGVRRSRRTHHNSLGTRLSQKAMGSDLDAGAVEMVRR